MSRVISGERPIAAALRERVLAAMRDLGYSPNAAARAMRTSRTGNVGVVTARLHNPIYPAMLHELGQALRQAGLQMLVWNSDETDEQIVLDAARQRSLDGVIFTSATSDRLDLYKSIAASVPVVLINRTVDGWPGDQVSSDNRAGGRMVASYFVQAGRQVCALITGPKLASTIRDREAGFRDGLAALGRALPEARVIRTAAFTYDAGFAAMQALLRSGAQPDAVFCANDVLAFGALDAARAAAAGFPESLWIVGFDGVEMAGWLAFDLTTVSQPIDAMVAAAVRLLCRRIGQRDSPAEQICLPDTLVPRGSTHHWAAPEEAGLCPAPARGQSSP